ncbi:unnamed protein product [Moneuplotes crassus]|uniref:Uncharacterized protein n=1 Tax=Euplotes crassus TaxID=5936 RepID=A0AAD1XQZ5_EUPCR|nr:unnamed protein product [Moneuplotes crassus]
MSLPYPRYRLSPEYFNYEQNEDGTYELEDPDPINQKMKLSLKLLSRQKELKKEIKRLIKRKKQRKINLKTQLHNIQNIRIERNASVQPTPAQIKPFQAQIVNNYYKSRSKFLKDMNHTINHPEPSHSPINPYLTSLNPPPKPQIDTNKLRLNLRNMLIQKDVLKHNLSHEPKEENLRLDEGCRMIGRRDQLADYLYNRLVQKEKDFGEEDWGRRKERNYGRNTVFGRREGGIGEIGGRRDSTATLPSI